MTMIAKALRPPSSVRSIRLSDELWAELKRQADAMGASLNGYIAQRLDGAWLKAPSPAGVFVEATPANLANQTAIEHGIAAGVMVPLHQPKAFNPQPKKGKK